MLDLVWAIQVETLKLRRTLALWLALLVPAVVIAFTTAINLSRDRGARIGGPQTTPWTSLALSLVLFIWLIVGLPMFVALETALLAGLEHQDNAWKHLFALPVARWSIYAAKLVAGATLIALSSLVIGLGLAAEGTLLAIVRPDTGLAPPVPWSAIAGWLATATVAAFLVLALHTWVATRWHSFPLALGLGVAGALGGLMLGISTRRHPLVASVFPWTAPFVSVEWREVATTAVVVGILGGVVIAAFGCWEVSRRDVL